MCKPKIVLCKPKPAMKQVSIDIFKPPNISDLEMFFKILLRQCTLVCDEYVPHITGLIRKVPFLGSKTVYMVYTGLHGLHWAAPRCFRFPLMPFCDIKPRYILLCPK